MVPLPTYQVPVATKLSESVVAEPAANEPETTVVADVTDLQPVNEPDTDATTDMSLFPVLRREPSTNQESDHSIELILNVRSPLISPQESVLLRYYRHKRPIAIVRPTGAEVSNPIDGQLTRQMWSL